MVKLVIVESPTKAKTIQGYLGAGEYRVMASVGHIRDLPDHELGVEPPNFQPSYVVPDSKKRTVDSLKREVANASHVYLATDPDREGEAISWHLKSVLRIKDPHRVTFSEVTPAAIKKALANPRKIHQPTVTAQEARRVADRLVGYLVSAELRNKSGANLTAGRVQSVALRLVVDRELEVRAFKARDYFGVTITLANGLTMELDVSTLAEDGKHLFNREIAEKAAQCAEVWIASVTKENREVTPPPALNTSGLQQAANKALKLSAKRAMEIAQHLFDKGFISYHRTDNVNLSPESYEQACEWLKANGLEYRRGQKRWQSKANAQEAHEAIRPTDFSRVDIEGDDQERAVYRLIRERALMAQMPEGLDEHTKVIADSACSLQSEAGSDTTARFKRTGVRMVQPGWRAFKPSVKEPADKDDEPAIEASVDEGQRFAVREAVVKDKRTEPPKRFTEASLVKKLESLGIGRPATYAAILSNIQAREYIAVGKDMRLTPSDIGIAIVTALRSQSFLDLKFTSRMEDQLDLICEGKESYLDLIRGLYSTLTSEQERISIPRLGEGYGEGARKASACPLCAQKVVRLESRKEKGAFFWVHDDEAHAATCERFLSDQDGEPVRKLDKPVATSPCPQCQQPLKRLPSRQDKGKYFWVHVTEAHAEGCVKYLDDAKGAPQLRERAAPSKHVCPKCAQPVVQRRNRTTGQPFWVHEKEGSCVKYLDDVGGEPRLKAAQQ